MLTVILRLHLVEKVKKRTIILELQADVAVYEFVNTKLVEQIQKLKESPEEMLSILQSWTILFYFILFYL